VVFYLYRIRPGGHWKPSRRHIWPHVSNLRYSFHHVHWCVYHCDVAYVDWWEWFFVVYLPVASDESSLLDFDGEGGRKFLRVLLNLVMHNYPLLVSGALQLLFRHFSQRQEVLQAFQQVSICLWTVCRLWSLTVNLFRFFHRMSSKKWIPQVWFPVEVDFSDSGQS